MLVKILKDSETPTNSLKKGDVVNLQSHLAAMLLKAKIAKKLTKKEIESYSNGD